MNIYDFVDIVDFVDMDFVDQAGARIWGILAASPLTRGGWWPWLPQTGMPKTGRAAVREHAVRRQTSEPPWPAKLRTE